MPFFYYHDNPPVDCTKYIDSLCITVYTVYITGGAKKAK